MKERLSKMAGGVLGHQSVSLPGVAATELAGVIPGDTVVIYGASPLPCYWVAASRLVAAFFTVCFPGLSITLVQPVSRSSKLL